jgi:hypothetical protein
MPGVEVDSSSSWAEAAKSYDANRRQLGWKKEEFIPVVRIGNRERRDMERQVDPLTMRYRDESREAAHQSKIQDKMTATLNRSVNLGKERRNIINGQGGPPKEPKPEKKIVIRDNHIIANMSIDAYKKTSIFFDEAYVEGNRMARHVVPPVRAGMRDLNIISNRYLKDDEARREQEYKELRDTVAERYWKGRNFNLVAGQYYLDEKEEQYQDQKRYLNSVHGKAKDMRLPPSIKFSEGHSYDIINHVAPDESKLKLSQTIKIRAQNRYKRNKIEAEIQKLGVEKYDLQESRKLNRVGYERFQQQIERGYDPLKTGNAAPLQGAKLIVQKPLSSWQKIGGSDIVEPRRPPTSFPSSSSRDEGVIGGGGGFGVGGGGGGGQQRSMTASMSSRRSVPGLDLSKAEQAAPVSYSEPAAGPPGLAIPMGVVRTGGGLHNK